MLFFQRYPLLVLALCAVALPVFQGCADNSKPQHETTDKKLRIVVTTGMIADAVAAIVGDKAEVQALMGPGVDPHLYKATQGDVVKLRDADVIFYNGLHLEGKMVDVFEKLARTKPVIPVSKRIPHTLLHQMAAATDTHDPHIWFDVALWKQAVQLIADTLPVYLPKNAEEIRSRATSYLAQLDSLHAWVTQQMHSIPEKQRVLITAHDAFGYFGAAYHIDVRGLQGISTVSEFGLKDISTLVDLITSKGVKAVFVESSVPRRSIEAVVAGCRERGHSVSIGGTLFSDAMGAAGTPEGTYIGMVKANVNTIVGALK